MEEIIYLTESKSAYLTKKFIPDDLVKFSDDNFEKLFALHPDKKINVICKDKSVPTFRYHASYLNTPEYDKTIKHSYMFTGKQTQDNLPELFTPYLNHIQKESQYYNQVVINWYENDEDYIALHSDCDIGMIKDYKIAIITLNEPIKGAHPRNMNFVTKSYVRDDSIHQKLLVPLDHGLQLTMCGDTQNKFKHGISRSQIKSLKRISISFRQFILNESINKLQSENSF